MICRVKICIVSDSHDRADVLERAVSDAAAEGAQAVIHCGDLIGAHTLRPPTRAWTLADEKSSWCTIRNTAMRWPAAGTGTWCAAGTPTRRASSASRP